MALRNLRLEGSSIDRSRLRTCDGCPQTVTVSGGVSLGSRWICAECWRKRSIGAITRARNRERRAAR